jgi:heat shock protein HtpX
MYSHQDSNRRKTLFLMTAFLAAVICVGWIFAQAYDNPIILYVFISVSIFGNIFSYWYSDKLVLSMYRAVPVTNESHLDLYNIVENLSITAGIPMPKVYVIPDSQPNAFATGRNKDHAAIAVTAGLLQILDRHELEGVIAHEISHITNLDILLSTVVVILVGFVTLVSDFFIRSRAVGIRSDRDGDRAQLIFFVVGVVFAILSPFVAVLMQLAISRKREYLADASGALLTRYPEGLASALEKISGYGREPMARANHATAHLFISNPFGGAGKKVSRFFMTHPPIEKRIEILRGMAK